MLAAQPAFRSLLERLDVIIARWHWLLDRLCDDYRPERHYMRGPGPKDRKSTRLNSSHIQKSRMPSSA